VRDRTEAKYNLCLARMSVEDTLSRFLKHGPLIRATKNGRPESRIRAGVPIIYHDINRSANDRDAVCSVTIVSFPKFDKYETPR